MRSSPTCWRFEDRRPGRAIRPLALVCAVSLVMLPMPLAAQMGNPGFMAPDTRTDEAGVPVPDQRNNTDILFVELVGEGGLAEVALGELAVAKAAAPDVKQFAERMVADHGAANDKLAAIAEDAGIPVPTELNAEHAAVRSQLEGLGGATFDLTYMRSQIVDHQKTAQLLEWEITSGQHAALQRFAAEVLPAVLEHLAVSRGIVERLSREQVAALLPAPRSE
jgi:putative membrane protein